MENSFTEVLVLLPVSAELEARLSASHPQCHRVLHVFHTGTGIDDGDCAHIGEYMSPVTLIHES
jgi:hypothetical protein